jgi:uncharacterized protein (TIGR03790 family)
MLRASLSWVPVVTCLALSVPATAQAQSGANVLLVANAGSPDSLRLAEAYARTRSVPREHLVSVALDPGVEEVDRGVYERQIESPVAQWLTRNSAQDRILYIVLMKGVPLRIKGTPGRSGTTASVDSELTLLYRRLTGASPIVAGSIANPYYLGDRDLALAKPFTRADNDIYLVTRLDGFTVADAMGLVQRAATPRTSGSIVLDEKGGLSDPGGDRWLRAAAEWLRSNGFADRLRHDATTAVTAGEADVLGYYSWGSNDPGVATRRPDIGFAPGAIAGTFVSTDARTFKEPPPEWKVTTWTDRAGFYAGSPQSLLGDLIRAGVTGAGGYVAEPYLDATIRPQVLFPAYVSGFNLAESFYMAMPTLSWQGLVVGDPLCRPFSRPAPEPASFDRGLDAATELPAYFSSRSVDARAAAGIPVEALKLLLRAEARSAKDDKAGSQKALEEATAAAPSFTAAHLLLASAYEEQQEYDKAIERYKQVLAGRPGNPVALNNLAYTLAVRKNQPSEALAYAERAHALSPTPLVADTLAWVQHLLGRDQDAARLLVAAVKQAPGNAEIRLHAAVVFGAVGVLNEAEQHLAEALRLDPTLKERPEVASLRKRLPQKK